MADLTRNLRAGFVHLRKHPILSAVVVLTLATCIGTSAALFSVIKGALLEPWPYQGHDRIVVLRGSVPQLNRPEMNQWSIPEYLDIRGQTQTFDAVIAGVVQEVNLTDGDRPEHIHSVAMTANAFAMLGVPPLLGRVYGAEEDKPGGGEKVTVMGYGLWQRRYGSDPGVVGRSLKLAGESYKIIGVMPRRFGWWGADLFFPLGLDVSATDRSQRRLTIQARLRPGLSLAAAQVQMDTLSRRLETDHVSTNPEYKGFNLKLKLLMDQVLRDVRPALFVLLAFMLLVYLIACADIANLLLSQAVVRQREMAVRAAMGAGRGQLVGQLMAESFILAVLGGLLGCGLAYGLVRVLVSLIPANYIPAEAEIVVDSSAVLFSLLLAVVASLIFGLAPAREAVRPGQIQALREGGARTTGGVQARRFQDLLVVSEVVLCLVVLMAAGLMIQTYLHLTTIDPGFKADGVLTMRLALPPDRYNEGRRVAAFFTDILDRVQAIPGVAAAGAVNSLPLSNGPSSPITIEGLSNADLGAIPDANARVATPGYFATMGAHIVQGRNFGNQDVEGAQPTAIVNEAMAKRYWNGKSPLGAHFKMGAANAANPWLTVVGVVSNMREESLDAEPRQEFFMPHAQRAFRVREMAMVARSSLAPEVLTSAVRKEVLSLDPNQPVHKIQTLQEIVVNSLGAKRVTLVLLAVFAVTALLLAAVGIFAVLANAVNNRQQEIGIRMALGAQLNEVVRLFVGHGLRLIAVGLVVGLVAALLSARVLASLVYGVSTSDPLTFVVIAALFGGIAALASYIPALRAAKVDPVVALHGE